MAKHVGVCPNCSSRDTQPHDQLHRWCNKCKQIYALDEVTNHVQEKLL